MNPAAVHAILIVAAVAVLFAAVVIAAAMLRPGYGRHRLDGEKTAAHFRSLRETPAPNRGPVQARRPADPPWEDGAVRAAATMTLPSPGASPAGRGQSQGPGGTPVPPEAAPSFPGKDAASAAPVSGPPGPGRHPFDGHREREPWLIRHPAPTGSLLAIGYGPFDDGIKAVIPDPRVSLRATGAHAAIGDAPAAAVRPYAEQWWRKWDEAVNEP